MRTLQPTETPFQKMLLSWIVDRLSHLITAIEPGHRASQIATVVAASGNPSGA